MIGTLKPQPGAQVEIGIKIDFEQMQNTMSRDQIEAVMEGIGNVLIAQGRHDVDIAQVVENARNAGL